MAKTPISITLDEEILKWIDARCKADGLNRSVFIESLIRDAQIENTILAKREVQNMLGALASPGVIDALNSALGGALGDQEKKVVSDRLNVFRQSAEPKSRKSK